MTQRTNPTLTPTRPRTAPCHKVSCLWHAVKDELLSLALAVFVTSSLPVALKYIGVLPALSHIATGHPALLTAVVFFLITLVLSPAARVVLATAAVSAPPDTALSRSPSLALATLGTTAAGAGVCLGTLSASVGAAPIADWCRNNPWSILTLMIASISCAVTYVVRWGASKHEVSDHEAHYPFADYPHARMLVWMFNVLFLEWALVTWLAGEPRGLQDATRLAAPFLIFVIMSASCIIWAATARLPSARERPSLVGLALLILAIAFSTSHLVMSATRNPVSTQQSHASSDHVSHTRVSRTDAELFLASGTTLRVQSTTVQSAPERTPMLNQTPRFIAVGGLAWCLAVPVLLVALTLKAIGDTPRHSKLAMPTRDSIRSRVLPAPRLMLVRFACGRLLLLALGRQHILSLIVSLPWSLTLAFAPLWNVAGSTPPIALFSLWLTATLGWVTPFIAGLYQIEETLTRAHTASLHSGLGELSDHILILGYGDLGRAVVRALFTKRVLNYQSLHAHATTSRNVLLPDGTLGKLFLSVATADAAPAARIKTPDQLPIAAVQIKDAMRPTSCSADECPLKRDPWPVRYLIPQVIGDATSDAVAEVVQFGRAAFVVSALRATGVAEPSQSILERLEDASRLEGRKIPAMLAIHSSSYARSVTTASIRRDLPVHYFVPAHIEGMNAANVLYAAFRKFRNERSVPQMLIVGTGARMRYLVDAFLKSLRGDEWLDFSDRMAGADPALAIISTDLLLQRLRVAESTLKVRWRGGVDAMKERGLDVGAVRFERLISRNGLRSPHSSGTERLVPSGAIVMPWVRAEASDYEISLAVLKTWKPTIVLVAENDADREIRSLQAVVAAVSRTNDEDGSGLPLVLVSGETGREYLTLRLEGRMVHYSGVVKNDDSKRSDGAPEIKFPDQGMKRLKKGDIHFEGDAFIDVLRDPVERIVGAIRAYQRAGQRPGSTAVEISFCDLEEPETFARNLIALAGLKVVDSPVRGPSAISLSNLRLEMRTDTRFEVRGFARVVAAPTECDVTKGVSNSNSGKFARMAVVGGTLASPRPGGRDRMAEIVNLLDVGEAKEQLERQSVWRAGRGGEGVPRRLPQATAEQLAALDKGLRPQMTDSVSRCCGMINCPIEPFHKLIEESHATVFGDAYPRDGQPEDAANGDAGRWDRHRARLVGGFLSRYMVGRSKAARTRVVGDTPFGFVRITCTTHNRPGSYALALAALLGIKVSERSGLTEVLNLTYASAYECHDDRHGVGGCFGFFGEPLDVYKDKTPERASGSAQESTQVAMCEVVESIEIRAVTRAEEYGGWTAIAKTICDRLNKIAGLDSKSMDWYSCEEGEESGGYVQVIRKKKRKGRADAGLTGKGTDPAERSAAT